MWSEQNSRDFIDFGSYYVPDRDEQIQAICNLASYAKVNRDIIELCCGPGLLAKALLERLPHSRLLGYDGSLVMLAQANKTLEEFGERFSSRQFLLESSDWRVPDQQAHLIVSSLAIHHLDDQEKEILYRDLYKMLAPGGMLIIADIVLPAGQTGTRLAAAAWDSAVRTQALAADGNLDMFHRFNTDRWNLFRFPDDMDKPSVLSDQLKWLQDAGFIFADVYWMKAGHAIFGAQKSMEQK